MRTWCSSMARGGKREGAGRKPLALDYLDRVLIGEEYRTRQRDAINAHTKARMDEAERGWEAEETLEAIYALDHRWTVGGRSARGLAVELADRAQDLGEMPDFTCTCSSADCIHARVLDAAQALVGRREMIATTGRLFEAQPGRALYGTRARMLAEVAAWASEKHGLRITPRFVEECCALHAEFKRAEEAENSRDTDAV